jgi:hypothetical protein|tara:strand:+ start:1496 stop:1681 length:186 start_codon:yes stop_codon:yes gene_type:complete
MSIEATFERRESGIVNTDVSAFRSAKARIEQTKFIKSMEQRIYKLECAVESLQQTCKEKSK